MRSLMNTLLPFVVLSLSHTHTHSLLFPSFLCSLYHRKHLTNYDYTQKPEVLLSTESSTSNQIQQLLRRGNTINTSNNSDVGIATSSAVKAITTTIRNPERQIKEEKDGEGGNQDEVPMTWSDFERIGDALADLVALVQSFTSVDDSSGSGSSGTSSSTSGDPVAASSSSTSSSDSSEVVSGSGATATDTSSDSESGGESSSTSTTVVVVATATQSSTESSVSSSSSGGTSQASASASGAATSSTSGSSP
jgi:hypothetical protein